MEEVARDNLIAIADAYGVATGLAESTISRQFHGKAAFLADFRKGACSVTLATLGGMLQKFSDHWPVGTKWPKTKAVPMSRPPRTNGKKSTGK